MQTRILIDFNWLYMRLLFRPAVNATDPRFIDLSHWQKIIILWAMDFIMEAQIHEGKPGKAEVVLACDLKSPNWRKFQYHLYKADRVPHPKVPWEKVHPALEEFKERMRTYLPWNIMEVPGAEADDIIAVLTRQSAERGQSVYIQSADADYLQLLRYPGVHVSRPPAEGFITFPVELKIAGGKVLCKDVDHFMQLSVLTGQGGKDNIFNVKTAASENWAGRRKPPFGVKTAQKVMDKNLPGFLKKANLCHRYARNKRLIDFEMIPDVIRDSIIRNARRHVEAESNCDLEGFLDQYDWTDKEDILEMYGHLVQSMGVLTC